MELSPDQIISLPVMLGGALFLVLLMAGLAADIALLTRHKSLFATWRGSLRQLREQPWDLQDLAVVTLGLVSVYLFSIGAAQWSIQENGSAWALFGLRVTASAGLLLATLLLARERIRQKGATWKQAFGMDVKTLGRACRTGLFSYAAFLPPFVLIGMLYALLLHGFGLQAERQEILSVFIDPNLPVWVRPTIAFMALIVAPLWEEIFFRGIVTGALVKQARFWLVTVAASLLFASVHGNLAAVFPLFVLAIGLTLAYVHSGSIVVPIVMHAAFNTVTLALALLFRELLRT